MTTRIAILGAGPGGYVAAIRAAQMGAEVTVIEKEDVGGTCLNRGCIPSKVMITTATMLDKFQRAREFGISVGGTVQADMQGLMARKNTVIQNQQKGILGLFNHHNITYLKGTAVIDGPNRVIVNQADGKTLDLAWDKLILATGTTPLEIPAFPFDGRRILSSDHALNLSQVPESVMIVGGGVIGCEFAFVLSSLGAAVTIVEALDRLLPLPSVDEDCSKVLQREMKKRRITVIVNRTVNGFEENDGRLKVTIGPSPFWNPASEKEKKPMSVQVDKMLVCIGRQANTGGLGLETVGLAADEKGWVAVNDRMETGVPGVYAIGDVLGPEKIMLAHVASTEGQIAAENAMGERRQMDYRIVPGAIFTSPEVASVGLSEARAKAMGYEVRTESMLFRALGKAHVIGEIAGQAKLIAEKKSGRILGVHVVGPHATDLIAEAALAIQMGGKASDVAATIHAHPTLAEIMLEVSCKAMNRSVHG